MNKEIVKFGESFLILDPKYNSSIPFGSGVNTEYSSIVNLDFGKNFDIPPIELIFRFNHYSTAIRTDILAPYNPSISYSISQDDFDSDKRMKKKEEMENSYNYSIPIPDDPYKLSVFDPDGELSDKLKIAGFINNPDGKYPRVLNRAYFFLTHIRLQIEILIQQSEDEDRIVLHSYESKAETEIIIGNRRLCFMQFYPVHRGPLAPIQNFSEKWNKHQGLSMYLPDDFDKLSKIKGKFILERTNSELRLIKK